MKILIRGGSIPAGYGCDHSYCDILSQLLNADRITVINRSGHKETSFEGVETFYRDIYPYNPDILVVHFGIDDAYHPVYRSEFKENLVQLVRLSLKAQIPRTVLMTSHPFENIYHMDEVYIYYRTIREVAVDLGCLLLPVHSIWNGIMTEKGYRHSDFLLEDTRYPNPSGHTVYADILEQFLRTYGISKYSITGG